jgi:2-polyprenyl-3-methyl-5-hydroxy-6-metoxy-1,4-benzoquinol methylase
MAAYTSVAGQPDPGILLRALSAYQLPMALKGAIELELFTHIAAGANTVAQIAPLCNASEKGVRVLCDYLTVNGFLVKCKGTYALAPETGIFLDKKSPAYMGSVAGFLAHEMMRKNFSDVAALVRNGGAVFHEMLGPDDPIWVEFARSMAPMMGVPAEILARQVAASCVPAPGQQLKVLDIAAGHGLFGIFVARHSPHSEITAVDWANVLEVARENAVKMGVSDRFHARPGSAFDVDLGTDYDLVLLPNFLHHFDEATCVKLLKKLRAAMKPSAILATVEFVPNEDRVSPPQAAAFSMMMLGGTEAGDAYTFHELERMFRAAGFGATENHSLAPAPQSLLWTQYQ